MNHFTTPYIKNIACSADGNFKLIFDKPEEIEMLSENFENVQTFLKCSRLLSTSHECSLLCSQTLSIFNRHQRRAESNEDSSEYKTGLYIIDLLK